MAYYAIFIEIVGYNVPITISQSLAILLEINVSSLLKSLSCPHQLLAQFIGIAAGELHRMEQWS